MYVKSSPWHNRCRLSTTRSQLVHGPGNQRPIAELGPGRLTGVPRPHYAATWPPIHHHAAMVYAFNLDLEGKATESRRSITTEYTSRQSVMHNNTNCRLFMHAARCLRYR